MEFGKLIGLYEHFYSKVYHCEYQYKHSHNHDVTIQKFLDSLDVSYGEQWIFDYIAFQFKYWIEKKYKKVPIYPNLIFGKAAMERFEDRNENWIYFTDEFVRLYQIGLDNSYKKDLLQISISEEKEKLRFEGMERLANCVVSTTMYNRRSKTCVLCNFSRRCKEIQKIKYPNIYRLRNETGIKKESGTEQEKTGSLQEV